MAAPTKQYTMQDYLDALSHSGENPNFRPGQEYTDFTKHGGIRVQNPDEARAMGLTVRPDGTVDYNDYLKMLGPRDNGMLPFMLAAGMVGLPIAAAGLGGAAAGGGAEAGTGAFDAGLFNPSDVGLGGDFPGPGAFDSGGSTGVMPHGDISAPGGIAPGTGGGTPSGGAGGTGGNGSVISRLTGLPPDITKLLGDLGGGVLGYLGSDAQGDAYRDVADRYWNAGAGARDKLNDTFQPGWNPMTGVPGLQTSVDQSWNSALRGLSTDGNPYGDPGALTEANKGVLSSVVLPATANYRGALTQAGGLGLNTSGTASLAGAGTTGGAYDAVGATLGSLTTPQTNWEEMLKKLMGQQGGAQGAVKLAGGYTASPG